MRRCGRQGGGGRTSAVHGAVGTKAVARMEEVVWSAAIVAQAAPVAVAMGHMMRCYPTGPVML